MRKNLLLSPFILLLIFSLFSVNINLIRIAMAQPPDIAVTSVTPSATFLKVGELVNITVVVQNQGTAAETFNVTLYRETVIREVDVIKYLNTTAIEMKNVTNLAAGISKTLNFTWDTTYIREEIYTTAQKDKTYSLKAVASTLPDETDTEDNTLRSPSWVRVICRYIVVIPQRTVDTTLTPGKNYGVSVKTDYNGSDIWTWQFSLTYNPAVLEGIEVRNGDLIINVTAENPARFMPGTFDNTLGKLSLTTAYFFYQYPTPPDTTSGPGTLANVTFRVKGTGDSNITLGTDTKLLGPPQPPDYLITCTIIDITSPYFDHILYGYFRNTEIVIHDMAVTDVTPSATIVDLGDSVNITVVVKNNGTVTETFDVKAYYDYDPMYPNYNVIGTKAALSLEAGISKTLNFTWDTKNVKEGNHTITGVVPKVSGETDTADNTLQSDKIVTVKPRETTPLPIREIIIGIVVIVAVIAVLVFVLTRRKKPPSE